MKDDQQVTQIVQGIVDYLKSKRSLDLLPLVAAKLTAESWVRLDPGLATVYTRIKLTDSQLKTIKNYLSKHYHQSIKLRSVIDPSIIAGIRISIAGKIIDATVNRRLEELKQKVIYD